MTRIAVLGGSGAATPEFAASLREAGVVGVELRLIGRSLDKLERVRAACDALGGPAMRVLATADVAAGVSGADIVVNQVRVGGLAARAFDETFPRALGIPGEETLGAGGFANALRTVPVAVELGRVIEREAPDAWVINLTNPAGIVHQALEATTKLRVITVCDSPITLIERAQLLAGGGAGFEADYVGMNHVGWLTGLRRDGRDVLADAIAAHAVEQDPPVAGEVVRAIGALPNPYLRYYYHPERMLDIQRGSPARAESLMDLESEMLSSYDAPLQERPASLARRGAAWYAKAAVPVVIALAGAGDVATIVGTRNGDALPWLPAGAVIELPSVIGRSGAGDRRAPNVPPDVMGLLSMHAAFECLTVEGILSGDDGTLLRGLMANPMVRSFDRAREVLSRARQGPTP